MERIEFNLREELTMPILLKKGYRREDITNLFLSLENKGFGTYKPGKRGKGCCAHFIKNENCPETFAVFSERKRYKKSTVDKKEQKTAPVVDKNHSPHKTMKAQTIHALWGLSQLLVEDPTSGNVGYRCDIFANQILTLHRIQGGGEKSIEDALSLVWGVVANRIDGNLGDIVSRLRGHGIVVLKS